MLYRRRAPVRAAVQACAKWWCVYPISMHGRTIDPRIPTLSGRSTLCFRQPGRQTLLACTKISCASVLRSTKGTKVWEGSALLLVVLLLFVRACACDTYFYGTGGAPFFMCICKKYPALQSFQVHCPPNAGAGAVVARGVVEPVLLFFFRCSGVVWFSSVSLLLERSLLSLLQECARLSSVLSVFCFVRLVID